MLAHMHPSPLWFTCGSRPLFNGYHTPGSVSEGSQSPPSAQGPFARSGRYPRAPQRPALRRWELPHLPRSYGPMRQTITLPPTSASAYTVRLCRLSPVPAGRWPFPALSLQSLYGCLDPYPAAPLRCPHPFLPEGHRPHLTPNRFGAPDNRRNATSTTGGFRGCSHSVMFRLPYSLDPQVAPTAEPRGAQGGRAVYAAHRPCGYPT